jgi:predicted nucleic-acid-binding protein
MEQASAMKAVDTNVVLRFILNDDERQSGIADEIFRFPCLIPLTVVVEASWVLSYSYDFSREQIADALLGLLDQPAVSLQNENEVRWALGRYRNHNADLADMIHLVASMRCERFSTFDRRLGGQAGSGSPVVVDTLA